MDISPSDRTIYLTEPTIEVLISFFTLQATASRSIFYLYRIRIPFHPKHQPFSIGWPNIPVFKILLKTFEIIYIIFHSSSKPLVFFFCFQPCNPLNKWPFTIPVHDSRLIPNSYCTVHMYKLSPATNASLELFIGAAQNLGSLCCFIYKSHWNIMKTGFTKVLFKTFYIRAFFCWYLLMFVCFLLSVIPHGCLFWSRIGIWKTEIK